MIIVSYDISDDKLRTNFAKYLSKFGHRIQYSVFEIDNSTRILDNIISDLKNKYEKRFSQEDSVMIFKLSSSCEVLRFGYAKNDEKDFIKSSPNLCVNSSFSYVVLSTLLLSSRDLTEWSLVYHSTLSYQRFYDLHSIHYDHLEGLHQLI